MSGLSELLRSGALQLFGALSFMFLTLDTTAMTASPSPSYDGNYTVSWGTTLGCTYNDDPPFYSYQCYTLYENGVEIGASGYSMQVAGRPEGSYDYYVYYTFYVYGQLYDAYGVEGTSVTVGTPPPRDSLFTQLNYQFQTRQGDVNYDGRTDLFVQRSSGGVSGNGVLDSVILRQNASGGTFSPLVPDAYSSSIASGWPLSSATPVVTDFNVDGYVDVEVKGVAAATGTSADDQIVFSSGVPLQPQPLGLRAVDASLKQFVGNSLDYLVNPAYFHENAPLRYFSGTIIYFDCEFAGYGFYEGILSGLYGSWPCTIYYYTVSGTYSDYTGFSERAVAVWSYAEAAEHGGMGQTESTEGTQEAAEDELEVEIGGWPMEEVLGETGEHTDANVRRALETIWAIIWIGRANAQEVETEEAPPQAPRTGPGIYLVGHGAKLFGVPTGDHVALEHNLDVGIPCVSNQIPTCQTISAHPRVAPNLYYVANALEDQPLLNMTISTVERPPTPATALWAELKAKAEAYDNDAPYDPLCLFQSNGYNSNSFIVGLINVVNAFPGYDVSQLWCGSKPLPASFFD